MFEAVGTMLDTETFEYEHPDHQSFCLVAYSKKLLSSLT